MEMPVRPAILILAAAAAAGLFASQAAATTGFGCYRVNVGPNDPLQVRAAPRASAAPVASYHWGNQPIIALDAGLPRGEDVQPTLLDQYGAEFDVCVPNKRPIGARWCPVTIYDGGTSRSGWIKRRFVDFSECP